MLHAGVLNVLPLTMADRVLVQRAGKKRIRGFDVDYRGGVLPDPRKAKRVPLYVSAADTGEYRAAQDVRALSAPIIWRQRTNNNGGNFSIDTNRMFIGGTSSGSVIALTTAYT